MEAKADEIARQEAERRAREDAFKLHKAQWNLMTNEQRCYFMKHGTLKGFNYFR